MTREEAIEEAIVATIVLLTKVRRAVADLNYDWHDEVENFRQVDAMLEQATNQTRSLLLMTRPHHAWEQT